MDIKQIAVGTILAAGIAGGGTVVADQNINPYTDSSDRYEMPIQAELDPSTKIEVLKSTPSIVVNQWNGESRITIAPQIPGAGRASAAKRPLFSKQMQFTKGNTIAFVQPGEKDDQFDIDFTLNAKPATNVFKYSVQNAQDADFFYQPPVWQQAGLSGPTEECSDTDCLLPDGQTHRPENVVGSYAVYSKTKRDHVEGETNYGSGKLFHIYRPKAVDANGATVWAQMSYSNGTLSVVVPQEFLNNAAYPVLVDPVFGVNTVGGTNQSCGNQVVGTFGTPGSTGVVSAVSVYFSIAVSANWKGAIYQSTTLLSGQSTEINTGASAGWATTTFAAGPTVNSGTQYAATVWCSNASQNIAADAIAGFSQFQNLTYTTTWPSAPTWTASGNKRSIYATFAAAGGAAVPNNDIFLFE